MKDMMGIVFCGLAVAVEGKFHEGSHSVEDEGQSFAVAMQDVNRDGHLDIFVTNSESSNRLYLNDGKGGFHDVAGKAGIAEAKEASRGAAFADFNGDGLLDLYVTIAGGANHLYIGNGGINFKDGTATAGVGDKGMGQGVCIADVDGDENMDIFVVNGGESNVLYLNDGKGVFKDHTASSGLTSKGLKGFGCAFGDVDEDGDLDLYVTNSGAQSKLYMNNGQGVFTDITAKAGVGGHSTGEKRACSFADLNGDGHLDLYYVGPKISNQLFIGDGTGHFTDGTKAAGVVGNYMAQGMNIADVDGDGDLDIMVTNIGRPHILYENDGEGKFKDVASKAGVNYHQFGQGVAFGDVNNDGSLDMYIAAWGAVLPLPHANRLLLNDAKVKKWLKVQVLNSQKQPNAFGAEVNVLEAGQAGRVGAPARVDGGSGFASQNAYEVYFGLDGSSAKKFDIDIRCPKHGWKLIPAAVAPNQVVTAVCPKHSMSTNNTIIV